MSRFSAAEKEQRAQVGANLPTIRQVATEARVAVGTVRRYIGLGVIDFHRDARGWIRCEADAAEKVRAHFVAHGAPGGRSVEVTTQVEPKTVKEYRTMCEFINRFVLELCVECGATFKYKISRGRSPKCCRPCGYVRANRLNADRQSRWRNRHRT